MKEKVAFISGASRGIGAAIACALAKNGVKVAIGYSSNAALANTLRDELNANGGRAISVPLQASKRDSIRAAIEMTRAGLGEVDILVNNAAMAQEKPFPEITDDDWNQMFAVNLRGPFALTQEVLPWMTSNRWGRIVNISSIGGQIGGINQVHYASAKSGLIGLTKSIARIYSSAGVTCNAIAPGLILTDMISGELSTEAGQKKLAGIPVGRIGTAEEVAEAVVFLCSPQSGYISGQTLNINGGTYLG